MVAKKSDQNVWRDCNCDSCGLHQVLLAITDGMTTIRGFCYVCGRVTGHSPQALEEKGTE